MPLQLTDPTRPDGWVAHTSASDPGPFAALLAAVPPQPEQIGAIARNVIAHYRAQAADLPADTRDDIDLRWLADQLAVDQRRHPVALAVPRAVGTRLQGCCRDHALFAVGVLRQHGVPARSRVGFAGYLRPDWWFDHVVAEYWTGDRWRRFDPEFEAGSGPLTDPTELVAGPDASFRTAAEVYTLMRRGELDPVNYGVAPTVPDFRGAPFVVGEVFYEIAHRYGDEVLLWDGWGRIPDVTRDVPEDTYRLVDDVAGLLLAADAGDPAAESTLYRRYLADRRLRPGPSVTRFSPYGDPPVEVALRD